MDDKSERIARRVFAADGEQEHNIEIHCFYDSGIAQDRFDECFTKLGEQGRGCPVFGYDLNDAVSENEVFEITNYDEFASTFGVDYDYREFLNELTTDDVAVAIMKHFTPQVVSGICLADIQDAGDLSNWIQENMDEYSDADDDWQYKWVFDLIGDGQALDECVEQAKSQVSLPGMSDLCEYVGDDNVGFDVKEAYGYEFVRGYSKGDMCVVIYKKDDVDDTGFFQDYIYGAPVYCRIEVDDEDYYVDSEMKNDYQYDKDEVISIMKNLMGDKYDEEIDQYLQENLPEYPECV